MTKTKRVPGAGEVQAVDAGQRGGRALDYLVLEVLHEELAGLVEDRETVAREEDCGQARAPPHVLRVIERERCRVDLGCVAMCDVRCAGAMCAWPKKMVGSQGRRESERAREREREQGATCASPEADASAPKVMSS
jgi:hypothetical protein